MKYLISIWKFTNFTCEMNICESLDFDKMEFISDNWMIPKPFFDGRISEDFDSILMSCAVEGKTIRKITSTILDWVICILMAWTCDQDLNIINVIKNSEMKWYGEKNVATINKILYSSDFENWEKVRNDVI